jgi:ABC-type glycerol-3-phosphate transport system substrate-binding protein
MAAAGVMAVLAAGCSSSPGSSTSSSAPASSPGSPSPSLAVHGTLDVFGAGTLGTPFAAEIQAFTKANPGVTVHS